MTALISAETLLEPLGMFEPKLGGAVVNVPELLLNFPCLAFHVALEIESGL